jgi:hypothetical protein
VTAQLLSHATRLARRARLRLVRLIEPNTQSAEPVALVASVAGVVAIGFAATETTAVPYGAIVVPVLAASLFLRTKSLLVVDFATAVLVVRAIAINGLHATTGLRIGSLLIIVITTVFAHGLVASRERLGVQGLRGDAMLAELRDRLFAQARLPELPGHWYSEVARRAAGGSSFGGDFVVAALSDNDKQLEITVVDVSGKGVDAATRALQLSGALGGILGSLPPHKFLEAANNYVCRQNWTEGFATAVHFAIDLATGEYTVSTAGHPRPVHFDAGSGVWHRVDVSGPMLGLIPGAEYATTTGTMRFGDALMLYTDGMIEVPGRDLEIGVDKLLGAAESLVVYGFTGGANRLIDAVAPDSTDDRALVLLTRSDR